MYTPFADKAERDGAVFAELGRYTVGDLPEGYEYMSDFAEWMPEGLLLAWDLDENTALSNIICGGVNWKGDDADGKFRLLQLSWQRYYDRNDPEKVTNDVEFANAMAYYERTIPGKYTKTAVNGYDALLVNDGAFYLVWFDMVRGLQFTLEGDGFDESGSVVSLFTDAELIAMAESVTEG